MYQVDAFTGEIFKGNPAGVVPRADGLTEGEMQLIARELGNSETAFILPAQGPDHDVWVRFFTPSNEVPICGHATISAHLVRALEEDLAGCTVTQKTGAGILPVEVVRENDSRKIVMTQGEVVFSPVLGEEQQERIVKALGLSSEDLDTRCPIRIVSTGHSKVMIGIGSRKRLNSLRPDNDALIRISDTIGCTGYYVFTLDSGANAPDEAQILTHGRMFAPAIGIAEDPVTGNASGPLGAYLVHHRLVEAEGDGFRFMAKQGEAMGRPGVVEVEVEIVAGRPVRTKVGGSGVVVFKTEIELP